MRASRRSQNLKPHCVASSALRLWPTSSAMSSSSAGVALLTRTSRTCEACGCCAMSA